MCCLYIFFISWKSSLNYMFQYAFLKKIRILGDFGGKIRNVDFIGWQVCSNQSMYVHHGGSRLLGWNLRFWRQWSLTLCFGDRQLYFTVLLSGIIFYLNRLFHFNITLNIAMVRFCWYRYCCIFTIKIVESNNLFFNACKLYCLFILKMSM